MYLVGVGSQLLVIGRGCFLSRLLLPLGALAEEDVVDEGVLQQGQEDKHKAAHQVHVNSLHVGDLWERLSQVGVDGGHGQHRSDPWIPQVTRLESKSLDAVRHFHFIFIFDQKLYEMFSHAGDMAVGMVMSIW